MSDRDLRCFALFCCLGLLGSIVSGQTQRRATQPALLSSQSPQPTDLELKIYEILGPLADLEKMTAEELFADPKGKERNGALVMNITGQADLSVPVKVKVGARIPTAKRGQRDVRVSYRQQGIDLRVSGTWKDDRAKLQLNGTLSGSVVPGLEAESEQAAKPVELNRTVQTSAGKAVFFKFQDKPMLIGDAELAVGRLHVARLIAIPMTAPGAPAGTADAPGAHQAMINLQVFVLSAEREKIEKTELNTFIAQAPSGEEILRRLGEYGDPHQAADFQAMWDLASEQEVMAGARVPTVQDINVSSTGFVAPSISYVDTGTLFKTKPARWERSGDGWGCDLVAELETSHVGESSVKVSEGVRLPTFNMTKLEGRRRFQSGRPEYFVYRGAPAPPSPDGKVPVYVARVVLTRPD